jgi:hypothetical protein
MAHLTSVPGLDPWPVSDDFLDQLPIGRDDLAAWIEGKPQN